MSEVRLGVDSTPSRGAGSQQDHRPPRPDSAAAKRIVLDLIPAGSQMHRGESQSLEASGIADGLATPGRYESRRPRVPGMDRATQAHEIRRLTASPGARPGSVRALTETGSMVAAAASGSRPGPYASGAADIENRPHTVPDFADAVARHGLLAAIGRSAASGERVKA